uniref:ZP domain-containing protein n=1 Tax=Caenorhabditis japonica TaxID=281687 RepID=A0A8R1DIF3_CAEJA
MLIFAILCLTITQHFVTPSAIVHMTQNTLNSAKFFELRRSPQKKSIRDSFEIKNSANFTPTAICDSEHIGLALNEHFADIRIFASDHSHVPECLRRFSLELEPKFVTRFDGPCGVRRQYKGAPSKFVDYTLRLIVSHNPLEITEHDRIYDLTCSFQLKSMQVRAAYNVKAAPNSSLISSLPLKPVPKCRYSLHYGTVQGPRTVSARVGETIYHRWKCATSQNAYIFKVYGCVVHDRNNRTYNIIDDDGCSLDEDIIPTPEYDVANGLIYTPSRAFRFANSNLVHFKCMISVCPSTEPSCQNSVPPKCRRRPKKRNLPEEMTIEQRLLRIRELMKQKRLQNANVTVEVMGRRGPPELVQAEPLNVASRDDDGDLAKYESIIRSYRLWTWILCSLNVVLVVICVLLTLRLVKNKYIMDIKDTSKTVFRRFPF